MNLIELLESTKTEILTESKIKGAFKHAVHRATFEVGIQVILNLDSIPEVKEAGVNTAMEYLKLLFTDVNAIPFMKQNALKLKEMIPDPRFGKYGDGRDSNRWRIELDNSLGQKGVEILTPIKNNKGLTHDEVLEIVPKLLETLTSLGFIGTTKTSLNINIVDSNGNSNYKGMNRFLDNFTSAGLSNFAAAAFLSNDEEEFIAQNSDNSRSKDYSKSFMNTINSTNLIDLTKMNNFEKESSKLNSTSMGSKLEVSIPITYFTDIASSFLFDETKEYMKSVVMGSHINDIAMNMTSMEFRKFGGKYAIETFQNPTLLGKMLRVLIRKINIFQDQPDAKEIQRSVYSFVENNYIYRLNEMLAEFNAVIKSLSKSEVEKITDGDSQSSIGQALKLMEESKLFAGIKEINPSIQRNLIQAFVVSRVSKISLYYGRTLKVTEK